MTEDTHKRTSSSLDETVPVHRPRLEDTQPVPRLPPPPAGHLPPPPAAAPVQRRRPCLSPFPLALLVLLVSIGMLAFGARALWRWTAMLPRVNTLILGLDRRPDQGTVVRSDTVILATVYPAGPRVALLSVPRDLYLEIPGYGSGRINTAHFWGEKEAKGGGPALAAETVEQNFGVPVDHYVRVDFDGFRAIVDAVGGIDVAVEKPIVDGAYPTDDYGTMRIEIPAGLQHMDGETALRYVRSRHGSSDLERAERQRKVLIALGRQLLEPDMWPSLPSIYQVVMENVNTDLTGWDVLLMAPSLYRVGPEGIEHRVVDRELTRPWVSPDGGAVLLPDWELIGPVVDELFRVQP